MKTIICGSGDVGYSIADKLSKENFEVTVVDEPSNRLNKISENLDVKVVKGLPSLPSVLLISYPSLSSLTYFSVGLIF